MKHPTYKNTKNVRPDTWNTEGILVDVVRGCVNKFAEKLDEVEIKREPSFVEIMTGMKKLCTFRFQGDNPCEGCPMDMPSIVGSGTQHYCSISEFPLFQNSDRIELIQQEIVKFLEDSGR